MTDLGPSKHFSFSKFLARYGTFAEKLNFRNMHIEADFEAVERRRAGPSGVLGLRSRSATP
jgi:hypothetical protein